MRTRIIVVSVLGGLVLVAGILVLLASVSHTATIGQVLGSPQEYYGKVVRLTGIASGVSPVAVRGFRVFHLTDDTGSIWVMTRKGAPQSDARIGVQGRVNTGIKASLPVVGQFTVGTYFVEEKRFSRE